MRKMKNRKGLTLIELVVVMTILIALAGLLIPTFSAMLTRGHTSTCSTNIGEVCKALQQYQQLYGGYPSNMDALSDGNDLDQLPRQWRGAIRPNADLARLRLRGRSDHGSYAVPRPKCWHCKMPFASCQIQWLTSGPPARR